jgi:PAS domain S-box-containing protein
MEEIAAVNRIPKERLRGMSGYPVAVGATGLALLVRVALAPWVFEHATFMPFFMAIIGTAWYGGLRPGLLATALSAVAGAFFLLPPYHSLWVESGSDRLQLALFGCTGVGICLACESLHVARRRAKQRREVLRAILSSMGDAVISTDPEGRVTSVNPVAAALTGWTPDEATGRPLDDVVRIVNGQTRLAVENPVRCVLAAGGSVGLASHSLLIAKDGTERPVDGTVASIRDAEGGVGGVVLIFRDATERTQAELRLAEKMRLLRLEADVGTALITSGDRRHALQACAEATVVQLDAAFVRIWTLSEAEDVLEPQASAGLDNPGDEFPGRVPLDESALGLIAQGRRPHRTNAVPGDPAVPGRQWAERQGLIAFAGYPLVTEDRLVGVMAVFARRPLSETTRETMASVDRHIAVGIQRKQAQEEASRLLAREQARLERLGHVAKASLTINSANTRDSVVGVLTAEAKRIFDVTHAEVLLDAEPPAGGDGALIVPLLGRCGRPLGCVHLNGRAGGGFDGEDTAILTQLAHMAAVAFENARLYEELRDADRRKDEFLALLAHELRNPLAPIRNALQVMRLAGGDPATAERSREMIERQVQQMVRLVDDLMDVSRISRGKLQLRTERVTLASVVNAAVETCRPLLSAKRQDLCVTLPEEEVLVEADPTRLAQVVLNLLNNAAKYTDEGGRIRLAAEQRGAEAVVTVKDTGIGISPQMLPRIFEMFTQVDHTLERSQGGLGIGLTLVKRLVELHGGTVEARSDGLGRGCEFVVRVPLAAAGPQAAPPDRSTGGEASTTRAERRILVVDDNRDAVDSLGMLLKVMGHTVRTAYDGLEAVDAAATFKPEMVLLDIGLPRLNGYEAARRIRELADGKGVLLVALTGWGQEEDRRQSKDAGFDHHLVKPVDPAELQRLLAGLARA